MPPQKWGWVGGWVASSWGAAARRGLTLGSQAVRSGQGAQGPIVAIWCVPHEPSSQQGGRGREGTGLVEGPRVWWCTTSGASHVGALTRGRPIRGPGGGGAASPSSAKLRASDPKWPSRVGAPAAWGACAGLGRLACRPASVRASVLRRVSPQVGSRGAMQGCNRSRPSPM